ncbi:hypothetical protein LCGC14_1562560 [marine sediment metagenome]|uniref:Uncharacterized protein n=1 Tax=marine sediment metagenome TaxID=412755 RepID=A0A0F9IM10_9ZZZZ
MKRTKPQSEHYCITPKRSHDGLDDYVLCTDGCYVNEAHCYRTRFGYVMHNPRLFDTPNKTISWLLKNRGHNWDAYHMVRKYGGPLEVFEHPDDVAEGIA